jgi:UDP-glucose 4-epimerase
MSVMAESNRCLITGGAGFIGSHLAERLHAQGKRVVILDNLSTGRYANVAHLENREGVELIVDSVLNEDLVADLIHSCDRVYHLASAVGVKLIMEQRVKTIETIFDGTTIVLRHCARFRKRVLVTSTSEVYGKGTKVPFREEDDVLTGATSKHRWAYACAKALDEFLALAHHSESNLPVAIVRLFNTVGPRQTGQYGMVVPRFVAAAIANEPIPVYGDGEQSRCFAHVSDVVDGLLKILETPTAFGQVVNIGNESEVTMNQLAKLAIEVTGSKSQIKHIPYDEVYGEGFEDMRRRVPSLDRARKLLNYQPTKDLRAIVSDVAAELKQKKN